MPKDAITHTFYNVKHWLQSLSFRTGVIVLLCCIPFYILSFAQMLLPISVTAKGILWKPMPTTCLSRVIPERKRWTSEKASV